ncbi:hypothetical protein ACNKHU_23280 [Shigella flexneri]
MQARHVQALAPQDITKHLSEIFILFPDYVVQHSTLNIPANEAMEHRRETGFRCLPCHYGGRKSAAGKLEIDEHASYIVDSAAAIAFNTQERMLPDCA